MKEKSHTIHTPLQPDVIRTLTVGDRVLLSGVIYTARDAAHRRMMEQLKRNEALPFDLKGQTIYYAGPCPAKPGAVIGSIGPTTSGRMDDYTPALLDQGLAGMIGKGMRNLQVKQAIIRNKAIYFGAIGGAGALIAQCVKKVDTIAFEDLGTEAIRRLEVVGFPLVVIMDSYGNCLYDQFDK